MQFLHLTGNHKIYPTTMQQCIYIYIYIYHVKLPHDIKISCNLRIVKLFVSKTVFLINDTH